MANQFIDGVAPRDALNAPSARPRHAAHRADPADRFADQMRTYDRMRAVERYYRESMSGYSAEFSEVQR